MKHSLFSQKLIIIFIATASLENRAEQTLTELISQEQWHFLEQQFITKPQQDSFAFVSRVKKNFSVIIAAVLAAAIAYNVVQTYVPQKITCRNIPVRTIAQLFFTPLAGLLAGVATHRYVSYLSQTSSDCHSIESFLPL